MKKRIKNGEHDLLTNENKKTNSQAHGLSSNPFLWLLALENFLRSLCNAGSYLVRDPEDDRSPEDISASLKVLNIERGPIEEHLAQCTALILEWTNMGNGTPGHIVFAQVSRSYSTIRQKWTDLYITRCMKRIESTADTLWSTDLSRDMHPVFNPRAGKGDNLGGFAKRQQKGAGKKVAKGDNRKGKGRGAALQDDFSEQNRS